MCIIRKIKIAFTGIFISTIPLSSVIAQTGAAFGPKTGLNFNSFQGFSAGKFESKINWQKGLFYNLQFPIISIQPELLFNEKRAVQTKNSVRNSIDIIYFEFPLLTKLKLSIHHTYFPHLLIGPNIAYNIHSKINRTDNQTGESINSNAGSIRRVNIGGIIGAGIDMQNDWSFFTLDVRYGFGFNNIVTNNSNLNIKNTGWSIALGVGEQFGK
jgi:hypothetical protein